LEACRDVMNTKSEDTEQDTWQVTKPNEEEEESRAKRKINRPRYLEDYVAK